MRNKISDKPLFNIMFSCDFSLNMKIKVQSNMVSGQLPPRKIASRLGLGFGSRLGLVLWLGGNQAIVPEENYPLVRVRVCVRVSFGVGGQLSQNRVIFVIKCKCFKLNINIILLNTNNCSQISCFLLNINMFSLNIKIHFCYK